MKISIGCDHSALELKDSVIAHLKELGHEVIDRGTYTKDSCDYTDYGYMVAKDIKDKVADRGIVICFTGIGIEPFSYGLGFILVDGVFLVAKNYIVKLYQYLKYKKQIQMA